jgi:hypothetical protein
MSMEADFSKDDLAVAKYVALDGRREASTPEDPKYLALFARCDAVLSIAPRLADSPELAWAFAEARQLARSMPPAQPRS